MKNKNDVEEVLKAQRALRELRIIESWKKLQKFESINDIPLLPKPLSPFVLKTLIRCGAIPKNKLIDGKEYIGNCRNASKATWDAKRNVFVYMRNKFGSVFPEDINHFEDDNGYDLFVPIKEIVIS